jgi:hypothetical protein
MFAENSEYLNPENYPKWIQSELAESKEIAIKAYSVAPKTIKKHYFKLILLYLTIVLFGFTVMYFSSIY